LVFRELVLNIPENLIHSLESIWDNEVAPVLIREFGRNTNLYAVFYQGRFNEAVMEIWDPCHVNTKESQVFKLKGVSKDDVKKIAKSRNKAEIISINNWS
jgi:hypothetical protein